MSTSSSTRDDPLGLEGVRLDGQFDVGAVVGEGGFGVVYRGKHLGLEQPVAIKVLKILSVDDHVMQEALFARFREEAKLLYTLSQESLNIVRAIHYGSVTTPSGLWAPFMVLEWLEGMSLAEDVVARRGRGMRGRSLDEAFAILEPVAAGLSVAHAHRVAHRDIKPANIFLQRSDQGASRSRVKLLDFGIAKLVQEGETKATMSALGAFTWLYAAPEQIDPRVGPTGLATDVYAFALLATELLTDREPVEAKDVVTIMKASQDVNVRPTPRTRGALVPDEVERVLRRALSVDPRARHASIGELWAALRAARGGATLTSAQPAAPLRTEASPRVDAGRPSMPQQGPPSHEPSRPGSAQPPFSSPLHATGLSRSSGVAPPAVSVLAPTPRPMPGPMMAPHPTGPTGPTGPRGPTGPVPPAWGPPRVVPDGGTNLTVWFAVVAVVLSLLFVGSCAALKACAAAAG